MPTPAKCVAKSASEPPPRPSSNPPSPSALTPMARLAGAGVAGGGGFPAAFLSAFFLNGCRGTPRRVALALRCFAMSSRVRPLIRSGSST
eukprot:scaffold23542_cov242-Isochrysis_galbana.AAC.7